MDGKEAEKAKMLNIVDIVDYLPDSTVFRTILEKVTGRITISSFDINETIPLKAVPFDNFIQIVEGSSEIVIDGSPTLLGTGQSIIIPAHASVYIKATVRFKMISTIIKSGYE